MENIILFYKYVQIANPEGIKRWQQKLCHDLALKGRVILSTEGINGTLAGVTQQIERYIKAMNDHALFGQIDFKFSSGSSSHFPRMRIVIKEEIVRMGIKPSDLSHEQGGIHLTPEQTHDLISKKPEDLIILDTRNIYESNIGAFVDAIKPKIQYFREFPQYIDENLEQFKNKQVLMYCTGGVRCERATAYLQAKNVAKKVYQIAGGIHRYTEKYPDGFFRGKNYVFDGRLTMKINNDVLGTCQICQTSCDEPSNCSNASCHKQCLLCDQCKQKTQGTCSLQCLNLIESCQEKIHSDQDKRISACQL